MIAAMDPQLTDEVLLAEYQRAPRHARREIANALFERHYERVARWCYRFTGDRESAADLAQDVFVKAHRYLDSFRASSRFSTWLYTIARNESLNRLQRKLPAQVDDPGDVLAELPAPQAGPEDLADQRNRIHRLQAFLMETLDDRERQVFTMHYGEDVPIDVITRLLRLANPSGAKAYIVSARRKLARAAQRMRARGQEI